jgi:hypothetical protein
MRHSTPELDMCSSSLKSDVGVSLLIRLTVHVVLLLLMTMTTVTCFFNVFFFNWLDYVATKAFVMEILKCLRTMTKWSLKCYLNSLISLGYIVSVVYGVCKTVDRKRGPILKPKNMRGPQAGTNEKHIIFKKSLHQVGSPLGCDAV